MLSGVPAFGRTPLAQPLENGRHELRRRPQHAPGAPRIPAVTVEVHRAGGLPSFALVGRADAEVKESGERVSAALQTSGSSSRTTSA